MVVVSEIHCCPPVQSAPDTDRTEVPAQHVWLAFLHPLAVTQAVVGGHVQMPSTALHVGVVIHEVMTDAYWFRLASHFAPEHVDPTVEQVLSLALHPLMWVSIQLPTTQLLQGFAPVVVGAVQWVPHILPVPQSN